MRSKISLLMAGGIFLSLFFVSCSGGNETPALSGRDSLKVVIDTFELNIQKLKMKNQLDKKLATSTMNAYQEFATRYKTDSLTPWYLYRAADLASSALGEHERAITYYDMIFADHKGFEKYPDCLFLAGFICQDKLHNGIKAKEYYDILIRDYPNHEFVDDAQAMISFFGKSDEQIIQEFEKKNQEKMNK